MIKFASIGIVGILIIGSLAIVISMQTENKQAEDWNIMEVDSGGRKGQWNSIAADSNNIPHIGHNQGWGKHNIFYAKWTGSEWGNVESISFVISESDEDGLHDTWVPIHLGNLDRTPTDDYDRFSFVPI